MKNKIDVIKIGKINYEMGQCVYRCSGVVNNQRVEKTRQYYTFLPVIRTGYTVALVISFDIADGSDIAFFGCDNQAFKKTMIQAAIEKLKIKYHNVHYISFASYTPISKRKKEIFQKLGFSEATIDINNPSNRNIVTKLKIR